MWLSWIRRGMRRPTWTYLHTPTLQWTTHSFISYAWVYKSISKKAIMADGLMYEMEPWGIYVQPGLDRKKRCVLVSVQLLRWQTFLRVGGVTGKGYWASSMFVEGICIWCPGLCPTLALQTRPSTTLSAIYSLGSQNKQSKVSQGGSVGRQNSASNRHLG